MHVNITESFLSEVVKPILIARLSTDSNKLWFNQMRVYLYLIFHYSIQLTLQGLNPLTSKDI